MGRALVVGDQCEAHRFNVDLTALTCSFTMVVINSGIRNFDVTNVEGMCSADEGPHAGGCEPCSLFVQIGGEGSNSAYQYRLDLRFPPQLAWSCSGRSTCE